jgi:hypothetical protein
MVENYKPSENIDSKTTIIYELKSLTNTKLGSKHQN